MQSGGQIDWGGVEIDTPGFTYQNTINSTLTLGVRTQNAINSLGTTLGVNGVFLGGFIWGFVLLVVMGIITVATGSSSVGLIICIPILLCGAILGLIPLVIVAILGMICGGGIMYMLWGKTG